MLDALSAVIFDMDGLLIDSEPLYMQAWQNAALETGHDLSDEQYRSLLGRPEADCEDAILDMFGSTFPLVAFRRRWKQLWADLVEGGALLAKDGAHQLLETLTGTGTPIALATSSSREYATLSLSRTGLAGFFEHVLVGDDVARGKPAPDLYLLAASRLQVPAARCLVLEDSAAGAEAGLAAGMSVILVPDLSEPSEECAARVHIVARDLRDAAVHVVRAVRAPQQANEPDVE